MVRIGVVDADPVVGRGHVGDFGGCLWHVACGTVIRDFPATHAIGGQPTGVGLMALETLGPVERGGLGLGHVSVGVMAGRAGQRFGLGVTSALVQLFDMAHDGHAATGFLEQVVCTVFGQPLPRPEVDESSVSQVRCRIVLKVALRANRLEPLP